MGRGRFGGRGRPVRGADVSGRGPGRHVHGGPLLCGERVSVAEGSTGGGGGRAACPHLPASPRRRGDGRQVEAGVETVGTA